MTWRKRTNWDRLNPEALWQHLQNASRNLPAKLPEKLSTSAPRAKAALNAKDGHQIFLTASSFYSIFTQVPKTFNSTVALQVGFLKHLGDVATVLLGLVCLRLFRFFMLFQTDWMMVPQAIRLIHPTAHSHFTICHALHFNSNTVQTGLHVHTALIQQSATTGYHPMHIHDICVSSLCIIYCTSAYYCVCIYVYIM